MSFKKLLVIILVVAGLFVLTFVKKANQQKESVKIQEAGLVNLTQGLDAAAISKITLYRGAGDQGKIVLSKNSTVWYLQKKFLIPAKQEIVSNLIDKFIGLKGNLRASSKELFGDFRISADQAVHIILENAQGKVLKHLLVSFLQPDWQSNFIREEASEKIILIEENILSVLGLYGENAVFQENNFLDLKVLSLGPDKVQKIKFSAGKKAFTLVKPVVPGTAPEAWNFEPVVKKEEVDPAKINDFLGSAVNLYANEMVDPALNIYGFDQPLLQIDFWVGLSEAQPLPSGLNDISSDSFFQLVVGNHLPKEKAYYVKVLPSSQVFKISESSFNNLRKDKVYFLKLTKKVSP